MRERSAKKIFLLRSGKLVNLLMRDAGCQVFHENIPTVLLFTCRKSLGGWIFSKFQHRRHSHSLLLYVLNNM